MCLGQLTPSFTAINGAQKRGTITFDGQSAPEIVLSTLKAFPAAIGAGANFRIDPSTATIIEVTNLNATGAGSFKDAVIATGPKIIIPKVEGVTAIFNAAPQGADKGNMVIWGQMAPGLGLTARHSSLFLQEFGNVLFRFMTLQGDGGIGCTVNVDCRDCLNFVDVEQGSSMYVDHCSMRYGLDQTWTINYDHQAADISQLANSKSTFAYNIMAEGDPDHNTATIYNTLNAGGGGSGADIGDHTFSRNFIYNISHRFPNVNPIADMEIYNNYVHNWKARLSRFNDPSRIDFHRNNYELGNVSKTGLSVLVNQVNQGTTWDTGEFAYSDLYHSAFNSIEGINTTTTSNQQEDLMVWWDTESQVYWGVSVIDEGPLPTEFFISTQKFSFNPPADGYWDAVDVPANARASAGHNRGINADGSPFYGYDDKDSDYINKAATGTSESTYRATSAWDNSTFPGTSLYADTDGDYMPDWFEDQFAFLDKNSATDQFTTTNVTWDFSAIGATHNYIVTNNAGYTNLEICAAFYAGDFETMLDGTNDLNITN